MNTTELIPVFTTALGTKVRSIRKCYGDVEKYTYQAMTWHGWWRWYDSETDRNVVSENAVLFPPTLDELRAFYAEQEKYPNTKYSYRLYSHKTLPEGTFPVAGFNLDSRDEAVQCAKHKLLLNCPPYEGALVNVYYYDKDGEDRNFLVASIEVWNDCLIVHDTVFIESYKKQHLKEPQHGQECQNS